MTPDERWLAAVGPFVRGSLPSAPATVAEIGCDPLGGFVPRLERAGYAATCIDPEAPQRACYRKAEFEHSDISGRVDAIVAYAGEHRHVIAAGERAKSSLSDRNPSAERSR